MIVFPSDPANAGVRRRQLVRVDKKGAYTITGLPAGEYRLIAIDERMAADWEEPAFLTPASRVATRVTVPATGSIAVDLRTSAIRRESTMRLARIGTAGARRDGRDSGACRNSAAASSHVPRLPAPSRAQRKSPAES